MSEPDKVNPIPHAPGVEKSVLSVLFQYPEKLDEVVNLTSEHFHIPAHRLLFDRISRFYQQGKPIETVGFAQSLLDDGLLDRAGGGAAIYELTTREPHAMHLEEHLSILTAHLLRRMGIETADALREVCMTGGDVESILGVTSSPITAMHDLATGGKSTQTTKSILEDCLSRWNRRMRGEESPMGIETSLNEFNRLFHGLHKGHTVVISGYPGGGKTTLASQFCMDAALGGKNTMICSLEMSPQDLMNRMLAYVAKRPGDMIKNPIKYANEVLGESKPTQDMLKAMQGAVRRIASAPFSIEHLVGSNVYKIAAAIRRSHRKLPLDVVVIDFAQRIRPVPEKVKESKEQQLTHASNYLADLAKELDFCLLLPSQLNKDGAAKHAETINEDADLHLQIIQDRIGNPPTHDHIGIACMKDRHHGRDGEMMPIVLDGPMVRFIPKPFNP